jgi:hypothetical protein
MPEELTSKKLDDVVPVSEQETMEDLNDLFSVTEDVTSAMDAAKAPIMPNNDPMTDIEQEMTPPATENTNEEPLTPVETPVVEETPPTSEPASEPVEEPASQEPASSTEPEQTQLDSNALLSLVSDLRTQVETMRLTQASNQNKSQSTEQKRTKLEGQNFIASDEDLQKALSSTEDLNRLLSQVHNSAVAQTRELLLAEIPSLVKPHIQEQTRDKNLLEAFFRDNQDLNDEKYHKILALTAEEVGLEYANDPTFTMDKQLQEVGKRVRAIVKPSGLVTSKKPPVDAAKSFAGSASPARPTQPKLTQLEKELEDLISLT